MATPELNEDAAIAAVCTAKLESPATAKMLAAKLYRDAVGCDLRAAIAAVEWALPRSVSAAGLPIGSVVAGLEVVYLKDAANDWSATGWISGFTNADVDLSIRNGAQVLRVGTGEG